MNSKVDETNLLSENIKVYKYRVGFDKKAQDRDGEYTSRPKKVGHLNALEGEDEEEDPEEEEVFAVEGPRPTDYSQEACPRLLMNDKCWSRECKFSHKPKIIEDKKKEMLGKWSQSNVKAQELRVAVWGTVSFGSDSPPHGEHCDGERYLPTVRISRQTHVQTMSQTGSGIMRLL